ncbi:hypothetical protein FNV43_RR16848 [Rhamnella rubrinervis]|uniref:DUF1985 domain-containing protein n=1 Tax=Rhamnella rubrinervis TaxID=2594499 RepID=A0A8K0GZL6_9ROSA|nr:hypothetical protein FNV43_RR16848 [Rhamnella rubrinervis]
MEFNFNDKGAIFTWKEFGLITGLKMKHLLDAIPPPSSNQIRNKYLGDIKKIRNRDVRNSFMNLKRSNLEDKDDMVKLTLIYFLECGILGKESQVGINEQHLSMVEDLNYFNQYAWGLESYNATIISMHRALGLRQGKLNESATYSLCLGYETIPLMGDLYANKLYVIGRLRAINADEESIYEQNENCPIPPLEQYVNEGPTNFDHEHEGFSYYHQQQHASNVEIPTINDFARPSTSSHYFLSIDSMQELQSIDMKVERMAIDVQSIDMRVDRMATEFSEFRLDTMQAFRSMQDSMQEAFEFMRKQYHPGHHDTHMHDATEDVAMGDEGGALDLNMNMVDDDSEVQYVTPSKMVQRGATY